MKKSLYKKFYITFITVTLAGFFLLGSIVLVFFGNYWLGQNKRTLISQAETIAGQIESAAFVYSGTQLNRYAYQIASVVSDAGGCEVLVINAQGLPIASVGPNVTETAVSAENYRPYLTAGGTFTGTLDGALDRSCVIAASPIIIDNTGRGVVYAVLPTGEVGEVIRDLLQLLLIATVVMLILMGLVSYFMASALVRPLSQMSEAAKCLAQGDFSRRIEVQREDEIGQLARAFNHMTLSLEAGEKMRKGFVANVSHELKTPMTTIAGFVDGILDGTVPKDRQKEYLAIVSEEVKRLSRLVNTMLNLSKLESGEITLHPVSMNLSETVFNVAFLFEQKLNDKQITLSGLEDLPALPVQGDADLLYQVVYNLLDNAVKYTPAQGWIRIRGRQEDGKIHLCVRNSGEGIEAAHLPFVFDRFYKVDQSRSADKNSLGLGLYLVKTIVSLHDGQITVRSIKDSFCEFELMLSQATEPSSEHPTVIV